MSTVELVGGRMDGTVLAVEDGVPSIRIPICHSIPSLFESEPGSEHLDHLVYRRTDRWGARGYLVYRGEGRDV